MDILICSICRRELVDPAHPVPGKRLTCPVCGSASRVYVDAGNFARCTGCLTLIDHVTAVQNKGLCYRCAGADDNPAPELHPEV